MAVRSRSEIFNREMDDYLRSVKRDDFSELSVAQPTVDEKSAKPLFKQFLDFIRKKKEVEKEEIGAEFEEEMKYLEDREEKIHKEEAALREEELQIKERKRSLRSRFFSLFRRADVDEDEEYLQEVEVERIEHEKYNEILSDMKLLGKISVGMLKRLPQKEIISYKESEDFETFRELLKKYHIIK